MTAIPTSSREYHLSELRIATSTDDPRRVIPIIPPDCHRILDVGCGAGQTLMACQLKSGSFACGVDTDLAALRLAKELAQRIEFVCAEGEWLPFRSDLFDLVISRVALPYMHIPTALAEMQRTLKPGGALWLVLHPTSMARRHLLRSLRSLHFKDALFRCWVLASGLMFHISGRQLRVRSHRQLHESVQTDRAMKRALRIAGFTQIEITRQKFFIVTARKEPSPFTFCSASEWAPRYGERFPPRVGDATSPAPVGEP